MTAIHMCHMWNVSVPRVCILTVLFVHILCNFSFHFFVALLLLRISLYLPPPTVLTKCWMKEYELWMLNGVNGQKNNGRCWTKTRTVDGIQIIRSGSGGGARNTNAGGQVNCGFYYSLRIIYPSDTPPFQYEPTQIILKPFPICSALRKQEVV